MRFLGIDHGQKRWGLSYGDELGLALPLPAAVAGTPAGRWAEVERVIKARRVTELVVGYPYNMDGSAGFKAKEVDVFIAELEKRFGLPVHRMDERLTTHLVETQARASGQRRGGRTVAARQAERATGEIDSRAAAVILQDYLDSRLGPPLLSEE